MIRERSSSQDPRIQKSSTPIILTGLFPKLSSDMEDGSRISYYVCSMWYHPTEYTLYIALCQAKCSNRNFIKYTVSIYIGTTDTWYYKRVKEWGMEMKWQIQIKPSCIKWIIVWKAHTHQCQFVAIHIIIVGTLFLFRSLFALHLHSVFRIRIRSKTVYKYKGKEAGTFARVFDIMFLFLY